MSADLRKEVLFALLSSGRIPHQPASEIVEVAEMLVNFITKPSPPDRAAYWPDKNDPLAMIHGHEKLDAANLDKLVLKFRLYEISLKDSPLLVDAMRKCLLEFDPLFDDAMTRMEVQLKKFVSESYCDLFNIRRARMDIK